MTAVRLEQHHYILVRDKIVEAASKAKERNAKPIHQDIDPFVALRNVLASDYAFIVGGYLVVYDVINMMWSDTPIVAEQLVLALGETTDLSEVTSFLEAEARAVGARYVCVGTALTRSDKALAALYQRNGYLPLAINLAKEIS